MGKKQKIVNIDMPNVILATGHWEVFKDGRKDFVHVRVTGPVPSVENYEIKHKRMHKAVMAAIKRSLR
jgi:hypothetical protein